MAKILDLREEKGRWFFRWKATGWGVNSDFTDTLTELKRRVPMQDRTYDAEADHEWSVLVADEYEDVLYDLFANARASFVAMRTQLRMF